MKKAERLEQQYAIEKGQMYKGTPSAEVMDDTAKGGLTQF